MLRQSSEEDGGEVGAVGKVGRRLGRTGGEEL